MSNTIFITANWTTGALSQQTISRQYDNNRYAVQFIGYPEGDGTEELDLYLLVWMSTAPGQKPGEITPIQLNSDQWYISNYFTQQVQAIKFQLCVLNEAGTYEAHSPIFSGGIGDSLEHDGTSHDIDVSTLFDAYREYLNELIIRSGAVIIDPVPTQGSTNTVSSGGVYEAIDVLKEDLNLISSVTQNLFFPEEIVYSAGLSFDEVAGAFVNSNTDTESYFALRVEILENSIYGSAMAKSQIVSVNSNGKVSATVTPSSNGKYVKVNHSGATRNLAFVFKYDTEANKAYTFSCNVTGHDPTTIGGLVFNQVQFEQNSVATDYIQHLVADDQVARKNINYLLGIDAKNTTIPSIAWTTGQYINNNGTVVSLSGFQTSNEIDLYPGQKIVVNGAGYKSIVAMIAQKNASGSYTPLVLSTDANVNSYEYTATDYIKVVVSTQTAKSYSVSITTIIKTAVDDLSENVYKLMYPNTPVQNLICNGGLTGIFHKIGCIGDSLASGETISNETGNNVYHDRYEYSWGQCIARMCGVTAYNFSRGGQSAITWMQEWANHATFTGNPCTLYLIGLGVNDSTPTSIAYTPIGTPDDIDLTDYTNNAETFYGQYAAIIQRVKQISEKAKIFVMTMPNLTDTDKLAYNTAIEYMATIFDDVFVMDLATYGNEYFAEIKRNGNLWLSGHGTAVSYKMCADFIASYIDWYVRNNLASFKNVQFIDSEWNLT